MATANDAFLIEMENLKNKPPHEKEHLLKHIQHARVKISIADPAAEFYRYLMGHKSGCAFCRSKVS